MTRTLIYLTDNNNAASLYCNGCNVEDKFLTFLDESNGSNFEDTKKFLLENGIVEIEHPSIAIISTLDHFFTIDFSLKEIHLEYLIYFDLTDFSDLQDDILGYSEFENNNK